MRLLKITTFLLSVTLASHAAETLLHYRVNDGDDLSSGVPSLGTLGDGTISGVGVALVSDLPTEGVPPTAGDRSFIFEGAGGILAPGTQQLLNSEIYDAGGFTYEAWFRYIGGGTVNSIIDYAGTEKLRRLDSETDASILTNAAISHNIGAAPAGETWHYAAVVFKPASYDEADDSVTGEYELFFDSNVNSVTISDINISNFGDSLNRTIGVGMHPQGFAGDFFNGFIYEPRVTLGALHPSQFLFHPDITTVTTAEDENGSNLNGAISLREAINFSPANSLITFHPDLDGKTITLAEGQLLVSQSLTIDATILPKGLTIDARQQSRIMEIEPGHSVALQGLQLTGGFATGGSPADRGGAIYSKDATLSLNSCTVFGNSARFGGGIYSDGTDGGNAVLSLSRCTLSGNSVEAFGGGILGISSLGGSASLSLSLSACTLSGNSADFGGGIANFGVNGGSVTASLSSCTHWPTLPRFFLLLRPALISVASPSPAHRPSARSSSVWSLR